MGSAYDIERAIEADGVESAVRSVVDSARHADANTRSAMLGELSSVVGVDIGADPEKWDTWLDGLAERGVVGIGPLPDSSDIDLPTNDTRMADLLDVALDEDLDGFVVPGYRVVDELGRGGMAVVYKAVQVALDRTVALKVLSGRLASDADFVKRFVREAKMVASFAHPNVVAVFDAGAADDVQYIAMEFVEGESLDEQLKREGVLDEKRALRVTLQIARALEYGRSKGVIHRDVKPANVLMDNDGTAKLADMGLARSVEHDSGKLTQAGTMMGTPNYISPEQAQGDVDIDCRADIYSLGASLFHLVAGRPPFTANTAPAIVSKHLYEPAPDASQVREGVSTRTALIVKMALEKDRDARYQTPHEMAGDIEAVLEGDDPPLATSRYGAVEPVRSSGVATLALVAAAVLVAGVLGYILTMSDRPGPAPVDATPVAAHTVRPARPPLEPRPPEQPTDVEPDPAQPGTLSDDVRRATLVAKGTECETAREFPQAVDFYRQAQEIRHEDELQGHIDRLQRHIAFERHKTAGDAFAARDEHLSAKQQYLSAHSYATAARKPEVQKLARRMDTLARYAQAMARARAAFDREVWDDAIDGATAALSLLPRDGPATRLRRDAEKRLASQKLYEDAIAKGRAAVQGSKPADAKAHARRALAHRPDDNAANEIIAWAHEVERRKERQDAQRVAALMEKARNFKRDAKWDDALRAVEDVLELEPNHAGAGALRDACKIYLNLPAKQKDSVGLDLVLVTGGQFLMGSEDGEVDERPAHRVYLDPYYIGAYEVTNSQYEKFDPDTSRSRFSPADDGPVVGVTWEDATRFCVWLSAREGVECRLPTEAEWEMAARGTEGGAYPWGDEEARSGDGRLNAAWGEARGSWADDGAKYASVAGQYASGASPCGARDMAGNVWEWCLDWYAVEAYAQTAFENPTGPAEGACRVFRGGSFANPASTSRSANRSGAEPTFREASLGFRVVRPILMRTPDGDGGAR